jgi:5-formyltetrahydrofolate cyclo-ligase
MQNQAVIREQKKEQRRELLGILKALPTAERLASDEMIRRRLTAMPQYQQASTLFIYIGTGWEVDTRPLIIEALAAGKRVAVPRCLPLSKSAAQLHTAESQVLLGLMEACLISGFDGLRQVPPLGLWEPEAGAEALDSSLLDFAVIPCVSCDSTGLRLGQGGGYYDRFLTGQSFIKAALCRQAVRREQLPGDAHDQRVDFIVTENAVRKTAQ